jgi:two-component system sensor histidine kinase TctE
MVSGNTFLLQELAKNLIDNALRYTPAAATSPAASNRPIGQDRCLEVEDNGVGITEEQAELVFERFYRVDDATTEGSGLGLAIVQEIAAQHDATASLRPNSSGRGAVARVVFATWHAPTPAAPDPGRLFGALPAIAADRYLSRRFCAPDVAVTGTPRYNSASFWPISSVGRAAD